MAPFDLDADLGQDFFLLRDSNVSLFRRREVLAEAVAWLTDNGYRVATLAADAWATTADFHRDIKEALDFPTYYGSNLDAFNDCLRDVATYEYGASPDDTGSALVLTGYDAFVRREPKAAQAILDIFATQARLAMLFGHRMACLLQTDDPGIGFAPIGGMSVTWNPAEAPPKRRRRSARPDN